MTLVLAVFLILESIVVMALHLDLTLVIDLDLFLVHERRVAK